MAEKKYGRLRSIELSKKNGDVWKNETTRVSGVPLLNLDLLASWKRGKEEMT